MSWTFDAKKGNWVHDYGDGHRGLVVDDPGDAAYHGTWTLSFEGKLVKHEDCGNPDDAKMQCDREVALRTADDEDDHYESILD